VTFVIHGWLFSAESAGNDGPGGSEAEARFRTRGVVGLTRWREARKLAREGGSERIAVGNGVADGRVDNRINPDRPQDASDADRAHRAQDGPDASDADGTDRSSDGAERTTDAAVAADTVRVERIAYVSAGCRPRNEGPHGHCRYCQHG
jgi:hypothetical protein